MAKVQKISKNITPAAGVFFAHEEFKRCGLRKLIYNQLSMRSLPQKVIHTVNYLGSAYKYLNH